MDVHIVGTQRPYLFKWPDQTEEYERCDEVKAHPGGRTERLFVAYGYREAFGKRRRRILVFRNRITVLAEFVGTDRWQETREVATFLRREGSKHQLQPGDAIPRAYRSLRLGSARDLLTGGQRRNGVVAIVEESDLEGLLRVALARESVQQGKLSGRPALVPICPPAPLPKIGARPEAIVRRLIDYREKHRATAQLTMAPEAQIYLKRNPFAYLMAACLDRGARSDLIWELPYRLYQQLGHLEPRRLSEMPAREIEAALRKLPKLPRYPASAARTIRELAKLVTGRFGGDAARVWRNMPVAHLLATLEGIWGVGPGIAHMTVALLMDERDYRPSDADLRTIDVKPDVHVNRVFYRTGLTAERNERASIEAGRKWHPAFPGLIDWPAWEIGRNWCHESMPDCHKCPLSADCARIGVQTRA